MRISTSTIFESGSSKLSELQARLMQTQQQIASGRSILTPADDPVGSARAYDVKLSQAANTQYGINRQNVQASLRQEESILTGVTGLLQDAKTLLVSAGNASYTDTERQYLATELRARYDDLLGLANAGDGIGGYLFSGFQSSTQPFAETAGGAVYNGDQGTRLLQVDASRQLAFSDNGTAVFEQIKTGNGKFAVGAGASNAGSGIISQGQVVDASLLTGHNYSIAFSVAAGVTTYAVTDNTSGTTLSSGNSYVSGQAISFDGVQLDIKGDPVNGDSFSVAPSLNKSLFATLKETINLLNAPASGAAGQARLNNGLGGAHSSIDNALSNILTVRAAVGSRLKEIDALNSTGDDKDLQYAQTLSTLQDLDYSKAISSLTQQQTTLSAAQQSFVKVSNLSLFNFI